MKRKIIKQGKSSYTITLPQEWLHANNITGQEEVDCTITSDGLLIKAQGKPRVRKIAIDLDTISQSTDVIKAIITELYRKGYDEIALKIAQNKDLRSIVKLRMFGFETFEKEQGTFEILNVAEPSDDKFESVYRKLFFLIKQICKEEISAQEKEELKNTFYSLSNYCRRILVKYKRLDDIVFHQYTLIYDLSMSVHDLARIDRKTKYANEFLDEVISFIESTEQVLFNKKSEMLESVFNKAQRIKSLSANIPQKEQGLFMSANAHLQMCLSKIVGCIY